MREHTVRWAAGSAAIATVLAMGLGALSCEEILGSDVLRVGECNEGEHKCSPDEQQKCIDGKWVTEDTCDHRACEAATGTCVGECAPESKRCAGATPQSCNKGGQWLDEETPCASGTHCSGGLCLVACVPGDLQCSKNTPQSCDASGQWQDQPTGACVKQTCISGACAGVCALGDEGCKGNTPQSCDVTASWSQQPACAASCVAGSCPGPSCAGLSDTCGPEHSESCCLSPVVWGGEFNRDNDVNFPAKVADFRLDRFEITVGRFRAFVKGYPGNKPAAGAGAHPLISKSGWNPSWSSKLPVDQAALTAALKCGPALAPQGVQEWTDAPGDNEHRPINCLTWYEAFAFCAWDGGRLPTEAEWNYAAAGGGEQRLYPWSDPPSSATISDTYAVYFGRFPTPVGSESPQGDGKWRQADLSGNAWEWMLDFYKHVYKDQICVNCANISINVAGRVTRGGNWYYAAQELYTSSRYYQSPAERNQYTGGRCARTP